MLDLPSAVTLFVGLFAADVYLFQFAHARHHELSLECFRMREKIMALREKMEPLLEESKSLQQNQKLLKELEAEVKVWCATYEIVKGRYYSATTGIKWIPVSLVLTILVGLFLIVMAKQMPLMPLWMWFSAIGVAIVPVLIGTGYIFIGDLWKAEKAMKIMDAWFACRKSPAESLQTAKGDEKVVFDRSDQPAIASKSVILTGSNEAIPTKFQSKDNLPT